MLLRFLKSIKIFGIKLDVDSSLMTEMANSWDSQDEKKNIERT